MKRCNACEEEFEDKFSFCPVDGTPLNDLAAALVNRTTISEDQFVAPLNAPRSLDFHLTLVDSKSLLERLATELRFVAHQLKQVWPQFRKHPVAFTRMTITELGQSVNRFLSSPNSLVSTAAALVLVFSIALTLVWLDGRRPKQNEITYIKDSESVDWVTSYIPDPNTPPEGAGVGVGANGRVGIASGKGEGSGLKPKKSTGGGGGENASTPTQKGIVPQPSVIPAPIPALPTVKRLALPIAGIDIDPALWQRLRGTNYGEPRSNSTTPSNGPGDGGGMGTGNGPGIGEGDGSGFGPGQKGNIGGDSKGLGWGGSGGSHGNNPDDPNRIYPSNDAIERVRVLFKPEPQYTEEARKNAITGTVVLRVVFSRAGEVTNIRALHALPFGLTERAIAAARQIRFQPATRHGQPVNVYMQLEYTFNLY